MPPYILQQITITYFLILIGGFSICIYSCNGFVSSSPLSFFPLSFSLIPTLIRVLLLFCQLPPVSIYIIYSIFWHLTVPFWLLFFSFPVLIFLHPVSHTISPLSWPSGLCLFFFSGWCPICPPPTSSAYSHFLYHLHLTTFHLLSICFFVSLGPPLVSIGSGCWFLCYLFSSVVYWISSPCPSSAHGGLPPTPTAGVPCPPKARHGYCGQTNQALGQLLWGWNSKNGCVSLRSGH